MCTYRRCVTTVIIQYVLGFQLVLWVERRYLISATAFGDIKQRKGLIGHLAPFAVRKRRRSASQTKSLNHRRPLAIKAPSGSLIHVYSSPSLPSLSPQPKHISSPFQWQITPSGNPARLYFDPPKARDSETPAPCPLRPFSVSLSLSGKFPCVRCYKNNRAPRLKRVKTVFYPNRRRVKSQSPKAAKPDRTLFPINRLPLWDRVMIRFKRYTHRHCIYISIHGRLSWIYMLQ